MLDGYNKLSVVVHCSTMRSHRCSGKLGSAPVKPAKKYSFHAPMAFYPGCCNANAKGRVGR